LPHRRSSIKKILWLTDGISWLPTRPWGRIWSHCVMYSRDHKTSRWRILCDCHGSTSSSSSSSLQRLLRLYIVEYCQVITRAKRCMYTHCTVR